MPAFKPLFDWRLLAAFDGSLTDADLPRNHEERRDALLAIAEVDYRLNGGHKCSICRAPVRAAMRSVGIDDRGRTYNYKCLCRRCLESEKGYCRKMTSYIAGLIFDEYENKKDLIERSPISPRMRAAA